MTNNREPGSFGLIIPVINHSTAPQIKMTSKDVIKWRAALPMADTGAAAKKLYVALSELNKSLVDPKERFAIVELFRTTTETINTELRKHYTEQGSSLTPQKITIANLNQTLFSEMADNYKFIIEDLYTQKETSKLSKDENSILITSIARLIYYINSILLCRYQLYSSVPEMIWKELNLLYKYSLANNILTEKISCDLCIYSKTTTILTEYTKVILLSATDPYQWRQKEQYAINKALELWALYPSILTNSEISSKKIGIYIIDLEKDYAPVAFSFKRDPITNSCIAFDLSKVVRHLKNLQSKSQPSQNPEINLTPQIVDKLIKIWSQQLSRDTQRFPISADIKVAFGMAAAHYYISNEKEFNSRPEYIQVQEIKPATDAKPSPINLPIFEIDEEDKDEQLVEVGEEPTDELTDNPEHKPEPAPAPEPEFQPLENKERSHIIFNYKIGDISPNGFCIVVEDGTYPPFPCGEIMVFKNPLDKNNTPWSIGTVRWIRSPRLGVFQIGIELVAPYGMAGGIQMLRDSQPVGLLLRCLIIPKAVDKKLPPMIITPALPLKTNKIMLYINNNNGIKTTLLKEFESSSSYYQYIYSTKENTRINEPNLDHSTIHTEKKEEPKPKPPEDEETNTEFDSIWKDL